jgi:hypothetical protein
VAFQQEVVYQAMGRFLLSELLLLKKPNIY